MIVSLLVYNCFWRVLISWYNFVYSSLRKFIKWYTFSLFSSSLWFIKINVLNQSWTQKIYKCIFSTQLFLFFNIKEIYFSSNVPYNNFIIYSQTTPKGGGKISFSINKRYADHIYRKWVNIIYTWFSWKIISLLIISNNQYSDFLISF